MNYAELVTAIQDFVEAGDTAFIAHIPDMVKAAEDQIYHDARFPELMASATPSTAIGNAHLTLPTDFIEASSFYLQNGTSRVLLIPAQEDFIYAAYPSTTYQAVPKYYAIVNSTQIRLAPVPDAVYGTVISYYQRPQSIVTASTSWIGTNYASLLLYACLIQANIFIKGEADVTNAYVAKYNEQIALLKSVGAVRSGNDRARPR